MATYTELNTQLVEEFGNLERLCNQIYDGQHGVTSYINDMENLSSTASYKIPDWNYDLRSLKDIRHKRNCLSHGEVSFSELLADSNDVNYAATFRKRILSQTDPLALYNQKMNQPHRPDNSYKVDTPVDTKLPPRQRIGCLSLFVILLITVFIVCARFTT